MIFSKVTLAPADPILGLTDAFKADTRPHKVNLGVGIYKDEAGQTPILSSVKKAEAILLETEKTKNYLGIEGVQAYNQVVQELLFGPQSTIITDKRAVTAQAPGGTGSLRVASEFLVRNTGSTTIWVSNPTWANHQNIFETAGLTVKEYRYYKAESHDMDFDAMLADLSTANVGDVVLLHGCCHNPTGIDLSLEQWQQVANICLEKSLLPLFDFAYQGFGAGIEEDAQGLRAVAAVVPELLIANSFSKNFGLYNERVGAVTIVAETQQDAVTSFSQIKKTIRANYSNPPAHGGLIVSTILSDAALRQEWQAELTLMRERIAEMRTLFVESLKSEGVQQDFSFISRQNGMFSFSGLNKSQVARLKDEFAIYIVGSGRISVAGLTKNNMAAVCKAIAQVI
ncbi:aspartate/tyrosine/aromatic aminotransferase [Shewanella sp. SR43-4]|uniref:Aminotransferase n=2 Tax=Shewanella TaxID=22 RepID=A0ABV0FMW8_9GAMM|nr:MULTISPECIES: amino acid aminotransferase [Shewanella]NCQ46133.1 aspartate/tyrosine/aromatic aminotransferase [Shewanella frigidimarina]MBB1317211.1 aspartate/tyrosine/aromatic aminotransferase [Shewanella sp. SR43-4]MBB1322093.1 aspartate/tyrosine/aromatic aminotransferase [Shewanella sp. SR43-8]NCO70591.1 aspartate/tyrosine/aromatic aminotransferase [Shewanella vesiculosa]NCP36337.1 aspartate/tyrosine/aromatic aminotransferase [Shewanella vesiculosa]|tara:strand:+ start:2743 stop:3936 length:1194 start_codon:yes stop_codon:yes gene_type:complete